MGAKSGDLDFAMDSMPIWVQLSNIPLELFHQKGIGCVANVVGKPLFTDRITAQQLHLSYARVYIEIVVIDSIPKEIEVMLKSGKIARVQVSVPWLPAKCMQCKVFRYGDKNCPKKATVKGKQWVPRKKVVGVDNGVYKAGVENEKGKTMNIQTSLSGKENGRAGFTHRFALLQLDKETEVVEELEKEVGTGSSKSSTFFSVVVWQS
ncbi:hypothetical protein PTKIN_Ptkin04bG0036600 [Pterospermum kingtungense]